MISLNNLNWKALFELERRKQNDKEANAGLVKEMTSIWQIVLKGMA